MAKIVVRLPEPKKEYSEDNQRQINRALTNIIEQLNSTYSVSYTHLTLPTKA